MTGLLPDTNADGLPVVPMAGEQRSAPSACHAL